MPTRATLWWNGGAIPFLVCEFEGDKPEMGACLLVETGENELASFCKSEIDRPCGWGEERFAADGGRGTTQGVLVEVEVESQS